MEKFYLGDGVYIEVVEDGVKLTTSNGISDTNTIYLDHGVLASLALFLNRRVLNRE